MSDPDPGWNDPPLFSYKTSSNQAANKRSILTRPKRVPFPDVQVTGKCSPITVASGLPPPFGGGSLDSPQHSSPVQSFQSPPVTLQTPPPAVNTPPPPSDSQTPPLKLVVDTPPSSTQICSSSMENSHVDLHKANGILCQVLDEHRTKLEDHVISDIEKRLFILMEMWKNGSFPDDVVQKIGNLSCALKDGDSNLADTLHLELMIDHVGLCSSWMVGVKQLIRIVSATSITPETQEKIEREVLLDVMTINKDVTLQDEESNLACSGEPAVTEIKGNDSVSSEVGNNAGMLNGFPDDATEVPSDNTEADSAGRSTTINESTADQSEEVGCS